MNFKKIRINVFDKTGAINPQKGLQFPYKFLFSTLTPNKNNRSVILS